MLLYTFIYNLLNVLAQIANKMGLQKKLMQELEINEVKVTFS
jgi:hypothetical protein